MRLCGTVVSPKGRPTHRQDHPKTSTSVRTVAVPSFTAAVLRERLAVLGEGDGEDLVFCTRNRTALTTNNVRRRLRAILEAAGLEVVTPHAFRRTAATVIDRAGGVELAASMLGHSSSDITRLHHIEPHEQVDPVTAQILESLAPAPRQRRGPTWRTTAATSTTIATKGPAADRSPGRPPVGGGGAVAGVMAVLPVHRFTLGGACGAQAGRHCRGRRVPVPGPTVVDCELDVRGP